MSIPHTLTLALADEQVLKVIIVSMAIGGGLIIALIHAAKGYLRTREVEQTKREVAAYVAEGTMTPADAQRILNGGKSDFETKIGTAVSWGMISSGKAERLIKAFREEFARDSRA